MLEAPSPCTILCFLFTNCDGINQCNVLLVSKIKIESLSLTYAANVRFKTTRYFLLLFSLPVTEDENPDLYQGLEKGKRAQSVFIYRSCNANSDYQRLSRPGHCPHEGNQERQEKSRSFYEGLTTERGARESVYMNPSRTDEVRIFLFSFRPFFYWFLLVQINWWPRKKSASGLVSSIVR